MAALAVHIALADQAAATSTRFILALFVDLRGKPCAKLVPVEAVDQLATEGVGFAGYAVGAVGQEPKDPDLMAIPDPASFTPIPFIREGLAIVHCDPHVEGQPWPYAPRVILKSLIARAADAGFEPWVGASPGGSGLGLYQARRVVLAAGGFPHDTARKQAWFGHAPTGQEHWSAAPLSNTGDGLRLGYHVASGITLPVGDDAGLDLDKLRTAGTTNATEAANAGLARFLSVARSFDSYATVVLQDGRLVAEDYAAPYTAQARFNTQSMHRGLLVLALAALGWNLPRLAPGAFNWAEPGNVAAALAEGRGALMLSAHFTPLEMGARGLTLGGAQVSPKHCNFMINTGTARAADLENLGEEVRKRVYEASGVTLRWEVKRIGEFLQ